MQLLTVSEIWIYPVKSLGGIALNTARVLPKGIECDRRWMLIDSDNRCMTQRDHPRMACFQLSYVPDGFLVRHEEERIFLPFSAKGTSLSAIIWNDVVEVVEVSEELSQWFSSRLEFQCRLVSFPEINTRVVDQVYAQNNEQVSLADGYPLLIIGQASLDDLNQRMLTPLPMNRFRPNIVFTGGEPYEEDGWHHFRIADTGFAGVKPCGRCVLTTVDQERGEKAGKEPLATLARYRQREKNVLFGQNLLVTNEGIINRGDHIILE